MYIYRNVRYYYKPPSKNKYVYYNVTITDDFY